MSIREYETIVVLRPDLGDEAVQKVLDRLRGVIDAGGGEMLNEVRWGKRKLAYEVKRHMKGIYHYFRFAAPPTLVFELERTIKMMETVIRYMTVKLDENIDPETRKKEIELAEQLKAQEQEEQQQEDAGEQKPAEASDSDASGADDAAVAETATEETVAEDTVEDAAEEVAEETTEAATKEATKEAGGEEDKSEAAPAEAIEEPVEAAEEQKEKPE